MTTNDEVLGAVLARLDALQAALSEANVAAAEMRGEMKALHRDMREALALRTRLTVVERRLDRYVWTMRGIYLAMCAVVAVAVWLAERL